LVVVVMVGRAAAGRTFSLHPFGPSEWLEGWLVTPALVIKRLRRMESLMTRRQGRLFVQPQAA